MYVYIYIYVCICVYMYIKYIYIISIYKLMHVLALGLFVINRSISSKSQKQGTQSTPILNAKKRDWAMIITQNWSYLGLLRNVFLIGAPIYSIVGVAPFLLLKTSIIRISWLQPQVIPISRVHLHISLSNDIPFGLKSGKGTWWIPTFTTSMSIIQQLFEGDLKAMSCLFDD